MLKEKQKLEEQAVAQAVAMKMKKEEFKLRMEIAEAEAREQVFAEEETSVDARTSQPHLVRSASLISHAAYDNEHEESTAIVACKEEARRWDVEEEEARENNSPKNDDREGDTLKEAGEERSMVQRQVSNEKYQHVDTTQALLTHLQRGQLPNVEIPVFSGEITKYRSFIRAFESRILSKTEDDEEKLFFLDQYTRGKPRDVIRGCLHMSPGAGYREARRLLEQRYGDDDSITNAFVDMLMEWPLVKPGDVESLDRFALTLRSCHNAMGGITSEGRETDHPKTMRRILGKLPYQLQDQWRRLADRIQEEERRKARFEDIVNFVEKEVRIQTNPMFGRQHNSKSGELDGSRKNVQTVSATVVGADSGRHQTSRVCLFCSRDHWLDQCDDLRTLAPHEKNKFIREKGLCYGCLGKGHLVKECAKRRTCTICKMRHPTVMHNRSPSLPGASNDNDNHEGDISRDNSSASQLVTNGRVKLDSALRASAESTSTMMAVLPVKLLCSDHSSSVETYAFFDNGSSATFCSESLLKQLKAESKEIRLSMTTASVDNQQLNSRVVRGLAISDMNGDICIQLPPTYTLKSIPVKSGDMASNDELKQWTYLQDIQLTRIDAEVGLLIGSNCPEVLQPLEVRRSENGGPFAVRTALGWVIQGPRRGYQAEAEEVKVNRIQAARENSDLHRSFIDLYNQDFRDHGSSVEVGLSREDQLWLKEVENGVRHVNGRYEIPLPLRNAGAFPSNKQQAERRAEGLRKRMLQSEKYLTDYKKFVNELVERDYAEKVSKENRGAHLGRTWYMPHHGVYHPMKPQKIRVVYDCSASYKGVSLNDRLLQGPNLTSSLVGVLLRFRQEPFALMGDVEKMFYQVRVPVQDRSLLRFLWWAEGDLSQQLEEYQMNVHLFGAASSPSCANFALRRTAQDFGDLYRPDVARCIERNFYVDDFLKSAATEDEAADIALQVRDCCARGGFNLTGFVSNSEKVMSRLPQADCALTRTMSLSCGTPSSQRALGVQWDIINDTMSFRVEVDPGPPTRRGILSTVSAAYDPLGLGAPFILPAKFILQDLCRLNLGWDDTIPEEHAERWTQWCNDLKELKQFSVSRSLSPADCKAVSRQLHHFADASERGYGTVSYIRLVDEEGKIRTYLLMSKARVAPLKVCTIPRLELSAAALAVQMNTLLLSELEVPMDAVFFWTDSISTLRYIQNKTSRFQTFVANRLSIIHAGSNPNQWKYVPSSLNPADDVSRGLTARQFLDSKRWTDGPEFLSGQIHVWPDQTSALQSVEGEEPEEIKKVTVNAARVDEDDPTSQLLNRFSDWHRLKKAVGWLLRIRTTLLIRAKTRKKLNDGTEDVQSQNVSARLTVRDLQDAESAIIRFVQRRVFPEELTRTHVKKGSPLYRLSPLVVDGTLTVGGRLKNSGLSDLVKHPKILPKQGHVTDLIIRDMHERTGHQGREHVLAALRCEYWIVSGNTAVRRVLSQCVGCRKRQAGVVTQVMSDLPEERVIPNEPPFTRVGTDYFGPFFTRSGRKQMKRYGVLFTCLTTRAVHIEIADSLDISSFISALRRFQARRGQVRHIRSDNGTNFIGSDRELQEAVKNLNRDQVHEFLLKRGIKWVFNAPGASHHGGVWERLIRTFRKILGALLKEQTLTDESLRTLTCEVEAVMNSRPLTPVSSDPADLEPLTPNHLLLLQGCAEPCGVFDEQDTYSRRRWRQVQYLADVFWRRWMAEYLPQLQQRQKWMKVKRNLSVGDLVLIVDLNLPRPQWPLGRVTEVFPDAQGQVRTVTAKTARSVFKRPISKLVLVQEAIV
ncbi:uncharacterized protein LOC122391322 [Amphibalanus amphitrite]|uniref:uncharacterized protein LOC122391322 n=1 Tax=Amphibalanus amphitrite TaxID=1232801 RepID=UPI001C915D33|nr:uncharacterized protein LOC122391322 [Amphibalanus amphitrite]